MTNQYKYDRYYQSPDVYAVAPRPSPPAPSPAYLAGASFLVLLLGLFLQLLLSAGSVGLSPSRRARCYRMRSHLARVVEVEIQRERQPSWLAGPQEAETVRLPDAQARLRRGEPLLRMHLTRLLADGAMNGVPVCPEQGPLRHPDSWHFVAHLADDGAISLRCRVHGW